MALPDWFWAEDVPVAAPPPLPPSPKPRNRNWKMNPPQTHNKPRGFKARWLGVRAGVQHISPWLRKCGTAMQPVITTIQKKSPQGQTYNLYYMLAAVWIPWQSAPDEAQVGWLRIPKTVLDRLRNASESFKDHDFTIEMTGEGTQTRYPITWVKGRRLPAKMDGDWAPMRNLFRKHMADRGIL